MGSMGPDQGFALTIATKLAPRLHVPDDERLDDAIRGCVNIALRRASLFSRAPVVHDLNIAFTIWGFYDEAPPSELVELRGTLFEGLRFVGHHYTEARRVADMVPEATLQMAPTRVAGLYPADWRRLVGA